MANLDTTRAAADEAPFPAPNPGRLAFATFEPHAVPSREAAAWRAFQHSQPGQGGPFQSLAFAQLVHRVRGDVRIAAVYEDDTPIGFLAVQRPSRFAALPVGAPINDLFGLVGAAGRAFEAQELCRAFGVGRLDFFNVPSEQQTFAPFARDISTVWHADIADGAAAYVTHLRAIRAKFIYHIGRQGRQLARAHGPVTLAAQSADANALDTLLAWKDEQLRSSKQPRVWRVPWLRRLLHGSLAETPDFAGVLFTLSAGERLIAANFCLRGPRVLQGLVMAHDMAFDHFSPGKQLGLFALQWAADAGFSEFSFGPGDSLFKRQFATGQRTMLSGSLGGASYASGLRSLQYAVRDRVARAPSKWVAALPGRAMRRLDVYRALHAPRARTALFTAVPGLAYASNAIAVHAGVF